MDRGVREHPELGIGTTTEGIEVRSVGNTLTLRESALVEAFNLKAAIRFENDDSESDRQRKRLRAVLTRCVVCYSGRREGSADRHAAAVGRRTGPGDVAQSGVVRDGRVAHPGVSQAAVPDAAVRLSAANAAQPVGFVLQTRLLRSGFGRRVRPSADRRRTTVERKNEWRGRRGTKPPFTLNARIRPLQYVREFVDAVIAQQTSPDEAYRRLDNMANRLAEGLRKATRAVQESREARDDRRTKSALLDYENVLER